MNRKWTYPLTKGKNLIDLDQILPIGALEGAIESDIHFFIDTFEQQRNLDGTVYANRIEVDNVSSKEITIHSGKGYIASPDAYWTNKFQHTDKWCGGDGIFSFNITDGQDGFDQAKKKTSLFVFGDTLVGRFDRVTKQRFAPLLMPNNSLGILPKDRENVDFMIHSETNGSVSGFFKIDPRFDVKGTVPLNTVIYDDREPGDGWLSGYHPDEICLTYDLAVKRFVSRIVITNYYQKESPLLSSRGIKVFRLFASLDQSVWTDLGEYLAEINLDGLIKTEISIQNSFRYFRFEINQTPGIGNHGDDSQEGLFGLNKVEFFNHDQLYLDVEAHANTVLLEEPSRSWIWLQDGVVIGKQLYFYPFTVVSDLNQPEGLQFRVTGIHMISVPIENEKVLTNAQSQKRTPFLFKNQGIELALGGAVLSSPKEGYIYVYGYTSIYGLRQMIVSRVKAEEIEHFDSYEYYDGKRFVYDIRQAKPVLDHISCEFSVSEILSGRNQGKTLVVYTYDVNTPYVAFSIGDSPVGPFSDPQIIYKTPEQQLFGKTTYTYNSKAHPHLSKSTSVLVSYNTNTYSFAHNMENADVYNPRFIRLDEI